MADTGVGGSRTLPLAGLVVGAWALLPPYTGPDLATETRVEVADHVVPGVVVIAVSGLALVLARSSRGATPMLVAGLAVALGGLWMTATHVPLVRQALQDQAPVPAVAYHTLPSLAVLCVGLLWAARQWSATSP